MSLSDRDNNEASKASSKKKLVHTAILKQSG